MGISGKTKSSEISKTGSFTPIKKAYKLPELKAALRTIPKNWIRLDAKFFARPSHVVARDLIGCVLLRRSENGWIGGSICETEAYSEEDEASHSYRGRTAANASMFEAPGTLYVYRSYGIHWCLNVSTGAKDRGEAVLIRAMASTFGTADMVPGASTKIEKLCSGPGRLCKALAIDKSLDGKMIAARGTDLGIWKTENQDDFEHAVGGRIGITKAVDTHWRFGIKGHPSLSKPF